MNTLRKLKKQRTVRRVIEASVAVLSLALLTVFSVLKEKSKVVETVGITPFFSYDIVSYTKEYAVEILVSAVIFAVSASALLADFAAARIHFREIDGDEVIIYNGFGPFKLLVNGEERDAMFLKGYLETKLSSGATMTASPQFFRSFHITFSDNRSPIEL